MSDDAGRLWSRPEAPDLSQPAARWAPPAEPAPAGSADERPDLPHWWAGFAALVGGVLIASFGFVTAAAVTGDADAPSTAISATYFQDVTFFLVALAFARLGSTVPPRVALGLVRPQRLGHALLLALGAWVVFFVVSGVYGVLLGIEDASQETIDTLGLRDSTTNLVLSAVLVVVFAPLAEEALFRGLLFGALWRRFGWLIGAVGSGVTFGLVHAGGAVWEALPALAALGFALAWLYKRTGSLVPCIGVHALNNAISLAVTVDWAAGAQAALIVGGTAATTLLGWLVCRPAGSVLRTP